MAMAFQQIDRGAGGSIESLYDRILQHEQKSSADNCFRLVLVGDWGIWDVYKWTNQIWANLRDLGVAHPCGQEPVVGYRLRLTEGMIALELTWQANPKNPAWPPIALQIDNLHLQWSYWELWAIRATTPEEPYQQLGQQLEHWVKTAVVIAAIFVLGPPLLQALSSYFQAHKERES